jgi:cob(I)alamin adenosyltransferase
LSIVIKSGDGGTTGLLGGKRVQKDDIRVECYGTVDELNTFLGFALSLSRDGLFVDELNIVQNDLHLIASRIALQPGASDETKKIVPDFEEARLTRIEEMIEKAESAVPPLTQFILYGGTEYASALNVLRAIARRAERMIVRLDRAENVEPVIMAYINRLSDLFFVLSRAVNHSRGVKEKIWRKEF